jgi:2-polyprenyl-3-methyl-5-hydroxy-6-metoxy-1,4-benzoquinol methylase
LSSRAKEPDRPHRDEFRDRLFDSYYSTHSRPIQEANAQTLEAQHWYFRAHYQSQLPTSRDAAILDLGCGFGPLLHYLKSAGYTNVTGVDISQEQVSVANSLGYSNAVCTDGLSFLATHEATFDAVIAKDLLEHMSKSELIQTLDAIHGALKPGGRLILQAPNADGPFGSRIRYMDLTHELAFTATSVRQVLRVCGFDHVGVYPVEPSIHGVKSATRWILWKLLRVVLVSYLAVETGMTKDHILTQNLIAVAQK